MSRNARIWGTGFLFRGKFRTSYGRVFVGSFWSGSHNPSMRSTAEDTDGMGSQFCGDSRARESMHSTNQVMDCLCVRLG
jgi:hypothetical protein